MISQQMHFQRSQENDSVLWILQVTGILSWIVRSWTDVENNIVSVERVNEYAETVKEVSGPSTNINKYLLTMLNPTPNKGGGIVHHLFFWWFLPYSGQLDYRGQLLAPGLAPERYLGVPGLWASVP